VLGNWDTAHIIKIPDKSKSLMGVNAQPIKLDADLTLLTAKEIDLLKNQVPGWRVVSSADNKPIAIAQEWKGSSSAAAAEIAKRLGSVLTSEEKGMASSSLAGIKVQGDAVEVRLATQPLGGLTLNDFILASRMNDVNVKDLAAKKRIKYWA
jgi:4a-hydroxytetrahydrobiopterin dehydratase